MLTFEYERQIKIKAITETKAEPPRAKIENIGKVNPPQRRLIPRDSFACLTLNGKIKFVSPEIRARSIGEIEAYKTLYGCGSWQRYFKIKG